jgi:hypothetical protein
LYKIWSDGTNFARRQKNEALQLLLSDRFCVVRPNFDVTCKQPFTAAPQLNFQEPDSAAGLKKKKKKMVVQHLDQEVSGLPLEEEVQEGDRVVPEPCLDLPLRRVQRQAGLPANLGPML